MLPVIFALAMQAEDIQNLILALGSDDVDARLRATAALEAAGDAAVPTLLLATRSTDCEVRERAKEILLRKASAATSSPLRLTLMNPRSQKDGSVIVTLRVTNNGTKPILVTRASLVMLGLDQRETKGDPFMWIEPGGAIRVELEGPLARMANSPTPTNERGSRGLPPGPIVYEFRYAPASESAKMLTALFAPADPSSKAAAIFTADRTCAGEREE